MENFGSSYTHQMRLGLWRVFREIKSSLKSESSSTLRKLKSIDKMAADKSSPACKMAPKLVRSQSGDKSEQNLINSSSSCKAGTSWNFEQSKNHTSSSSRSKTKSTSTSTRSPPSLVFLIFTITFIFLSLSVNFSEGCGPGRGSGRRRAPRKLTPLVYKEHVPNIAENLVAASGSNEGKITRQDHPRFKDLVPNYNTDIVFRDDEGTGADRLMTQRCKEKLNTLAISVMNQWPGVRLRVIEGWDEENLHAPQSLHYEGRAVDITTSDKDRSKYGMLARLAVEAGFDWVYYESRAHIHCSVKSDSSQTVRSGGCFSANSTVTTRDRGVQPLSSLQVGEEVLTVSPDTGVPTFSPVLLFLDRNSSETREFLHVKTNRTRLTLTPSHLLFSMRTTPSGVVDLRKTPAQLFATEATITFARSIQVGDWLLTMIDGQVVLDKVLAIESSLETGVFAPLTMSGTILVDNVLSSCYAVIESQRLAHTAFLPFRLIHELKSGVSFVWHRLTLLRTIMTSGQGHPALIRMLSQSERVARSAKVMASSGQDEGIYWYAAWLYSLTRRILPQNLLYDALE